MLPLQGDSVDQNTGGQAVSEPQNSIEQVAQVAAQAVGVDYQASYNALVQEYNDTKNALEVLKQDYEAAKKLLDAASQHSNFAHIIQVIKGLF